MTAASHNSLVASLCECVARPGDVTLWEGLPHQVLERDLQENERRSKQVRELGGFLFYLAPLLVRQEDALVLRETFSQAKTLLPFSGEKWCGGFHPDFALEWQRGDTTCYSLVCFGCVEVVSIAQDAVLRTDLASEAFVRLYRVLSPYRVNRPLGARDQNIEGSVRFQEALLLHGVTDPKDASPELLQKIFNSLMPGHDA